MGKQIFIFSGAQIECRLAVSAVWVADRMPKFRSHYADGI